MEMTTGVIVQRRNEKQVVTIRDIYSAIIALIPVIMIVNVPIVNLGASTVLLGAFAPYALFRYQYGKKQVRFFPVFLMLAFYCIRAVGSTVTQFLLVIVMAHAYGATQGSLDIRIVRKTIETAAILAAAIVVVQTLLHYLLGVNFSVLIPELILEENRYYFNKAVGSLYRPSAFFLEPSHYVQYCCLGLLSALFPMDGKKADIKKALWIMMGCFLTTSGMGIVLCVGVFGWYVLFTRQKTSVKVVSLLGWAVVALIAFTVLMQFSFFSKAVQRIFGEVDGYNAIWGRTLYWDVYITPLQGMDAFFGKGRLNMPEGYMTGLMTIIYSYGYLGAGLLLNAYLYIFVKSKDVVARAICIIYCGLMCIAGLSGFISMSFWLCIAIVCALSDNADARKNKQGSLRGE